MWWGAAIDPVIAEDVLRAWGYPAAVFALKPGAEEAEMVARLRDLLAKCTVDRLRDAIRTALPPVLRPVCDNAHAVVRFAHAFSAVVDVVFGTRVDSPLRTIAQVGSVEAVVAIMAAQFLVIADADAEFSEALLGEAVPTWHEDLPVWDSAAQVINRIPADTLARVRSGDTCWCDGVAMPERSTVWAAIRQICGSAPRLPVTRPVCWRAGCGRWRGVSASSDASQAPQVA